MAHDEDLAGVVDLYYRSLYQYAYRLTHSEADASDLTQQTYYIWQIKGHQLREANKVKTWLFTTLHREYLNSRRIYQRFPHFELEQAIHELPAAPEPDFETLDASTVLEALTRLEEPFQAPVILFYLEDCSYKEIADILGIPIGTVKSRLSRGLAQLHQFLTEPSATPSHYEGRPHE